MPTTVLTPAPAHEHAPLVATAFSASQLHQLANLPADPALACETRDAVLRAAGFRLLGRRRPVIDGPATVIEAQDANWLAAGWLVDVPASLGNARYLGVTHTVLVRTITTGPDPLDKSEERSGRTLDEALARALEKRLEPWGVDEVLELVAARQVEAPAIVQIQWTPQDLTIIEITSDDPLRAEQPPAVVRRD